MSQRRPSPGGGCTAASAALDTGRVSSWSFRVGGPDAPGAASAGVSSRPTLRTPGLTQFPLLVLTPQSWVLSFLPCLPSHRTLTHSPRAERKVPALGRVESWGQEWHLQGLRGGLWPCPGRTSRQGSLRGVRGRTRPPWDLPSASWRSERNTGCCLEEAPSRAPLSL